MHASWYITSYLIMHEAVLHAWYNKIMYVNDALNKKMKKLFIREMGMCNNALWSEESF